MFDKKAYNKTYNRGRRKEVTPAEYNVWASMNKRCSNPKTKEYKYYGGKGVSVCSRWNPQLGGSFDNFLADVGPRPSPKHTIDRENNAGNYEPSNCRWATKLQQARNTSKNVRFEYAGESLTLSAEELSR